MKDIAPTYTSILDFVIGDNVADQERTCEFDLHGLPYANFCFAIHFNAILASLPSAIL